MGDTFDWDRSPQWYRNAKKEQEQSRITEYMNHEEKEIKELYDEAVKALDIIVENPVPAIYDNAAIVLSNLLTIKNLAIKAIRRNEK